jgi:predicted Zn-dependent protease
MLTRDQASAIFDKLRSYTNADEVELLISSGRSALTRFANNTIHQNVAEDSHALSLRVSIEVGSAKGGSTARASTNKIDDESLRRLAQTAETLVRMQQADPELLPMPTPQEVAAAEANGDGNVRRHIASTARIDAQDRAEAVARVVDVAKRNNLTSAGIYASSEFGEGLFNSHGVVKWHEQTSAEVSITMIGDSSSGWQKANAPDVANLNPVKLAEIAAEKAIRSANPRELEPGKYTVILEPSAVLDIVGFMFWDFSGSALLEQRSFLNDRLGTQLFGENITIEDDVYHSLQTGAAFDGEGMTRQRLTLIDKGVVQDLAYSRGAARKMLQSEMAAKVGTVRPTGQGFMVPNEMGEAPLNIVFRGATSGRSQTVEEMIAATERGILVTRLWYIREVDPYEKVLTGMTRDGTFLVESGKVQCGVRNFRFNQSLIQMLRNVESLGEAVRASGEESIDMVVPPMKVRDFNFTEATKF